MAENIKVFAWDFWRTLTRPIPSTFASMALNARGRLSFTMVVSLLISLITFIILESALGSLPRSILVNSIEMLLGYPLFTLIWAYSAYKICRKVFHRKKSDYEGMLYALLVFYTVSQVIGLIALPITLSSTTGAQVVTWAGYAYMLTLAVISLVSLGRLNVWQSVITVAASSLLTIIGLVIVNLFIASLIQTLPRAF